MFEEKRKFPRFDVRINVSYTLVGTATGGQSLTKDISGGGMRFITQHALATGTLLEMTVRVLQREEPVRFIGKVVWSKPRGHAETAPADSETEVGVEFVEINPKDRVLMIQEGALYRSSGRSQQH